MHCYWMSENNQNKYNNKSPAQLLGCSYSLCQKRKLGPYKFIFDVECCAVIKKGLIWPKFEEIWTEKKTLFIFVFSIETDNQSNYLDIDTAKLYNKVKVVVYSRHFNTHTKIK